MWATYNIGDTSGFGGDAQAALRSIKARVLLISIKEDLLVLPDQIAFTKNSIPNATLVEIATPFGHVACCGLDPDTNKIFDREIGRFLAKLK
jgi:homoserine O-acetyltransferase